MNNNGDLPKNVEELLSTGIKAQIMDRSDVLSLDVDVLFLAALGGQVHKENMAHIKARIIVEGANDPVTGDADKYLSEQGVIIIPDILANAGGVIVSYFEWIQGRETQFLCESIIYKRLFAKMKDTFDIIYPKYFQNGLTLRQNCYVHSVTRISTILYRQGKLY